MKHLSIYILIIGALLLSHQAQSQELHVVKIPESTVLPNGFGAAKVLYNQNNYFASKQEKRLPSSYDLRDYNWVSKVKNKYQCGCCWTFATMASIESHWMKLGLGEFDLSEQNLRTCNGFYTGSTGACTGGNIQKSIAYLSRGNGPISESDAPYSPNPSDACTNATPVALSPEGVILPEDNDAIKEAIIEHGALFSGMYYDDAYFNSATNSYYYSGSLDPNHAITIVGWDDDLNLNGRKGYWIVKNDFGQYWGENGFFYVSYADNVMTFETGYFPVRYSYDNADKIYYHDTLGYTAKIGYAMEEAYAMAKFTSQSYRPITRIGTYMNTFGGSVEGWVYQYFDGSSLSGQLAYIPKVTFDNTGFFLFDLESPLAIEKGRDFYVKIKYTTPGEDYPIPVEGEVAQYSYPHISSNKCWISHNGSGWLALGKQSSDETNHYDVCIKAYTTLGLSSTQEKLNIFEKVKLFPNPTNNQITIQSSTLPILAVQIFDISGKLIFKNNPAGTKSLSLSTTEWKSGSYIVVVNLNNEETERKLLMVK
jgi:C1A family cysteine protease